jgi:hypothetical protein
MKRINSKKNIQSKMRTFQEFISLCEATYDPEVHGRSQITGPVVPGGRIGRDRRLPPPQRRRMKSVGGGKMVPVQYKERKDTGIPRPPETRVQQPEQERGSTDVINAFAAAAKEERKKAALARREAAKSGESVPTVQQPKLKDLEKQATVLLSKRKPETVSPDYEPQKPSGLSRTERRALTRKGERELIDLVLQSTGKTSKKDLKHRYTSK